MARDFDLLVKFVHKIVLVMPELLIPIAQRKKKAGAGEAFGTKKEKCTEVCFCLSLETEAH